MGYVKTSVLAACVATLAMTAAAQNCTDINSAEFKKTVMAQNLESPMKMSVAKDGRVFFTLRTGSVWVYNPTTSATKKILDIPVADNRSNEDGVLGIALDPNFESNSWVYVYHTLKTPVFQVSRYTLAADALGSEKIVLSIPHPFKQYTTNTLIIHAAGAIDFDPSGNLLIATGDLKITSGGFDIPVNDNTDNFDAQETSANSNSLLGKILRITPKDDGTYTIPTGNLFAPGTANTKPEIYAMGVRNPFTMTIDPQTGWAYSGEVGPDGTGGAIQSQDEVNQIRQAANLGWPYLTGDNQAYNDMSGKKYDPANLVNNSKRNTGIKTLPAPTKSLFWFSNTTSWPITGVKPQGGNRCIKVGAFYRFNAQSKNPNRLPPAMTNGFFMANHEEDNATFRFFKLTDDGALASVKTVMTGLERPMDFKLGADGALYVIEWGGDNAHWLNNLKGKLSRIDYTGTCSTVGINSANSSAGFLSPKLHPIYPGQRIQFPGTATSVLLFDLHGKKIAQYSRQSFGDNKEIPGSHNGVIYARFF